MLCDSTEGRVRNTPLSEAVLQGFAPDGGLYLPQALPNISKKELKRWRGLSFLELSIELGRSLFEGELSPEVVEALFEKAFNFPTPFISFSETVHCLELFHGPTLSFKDFGARLLAQYLHHIDHPKPLFVLAATTGDTGSAVGQAFYGLDAFQVALLYAKGEITPSQEQQIATIGGNIHPFEVDASFEICQEMVQQACLDPELPATTANSINLIRLFGQLLYYFYAYTQLETEQEICISVPCGNFGHLVSGILAKRMGLPISHFIAATNINDEVPQFLETGIFTPHPAYKTVAVSMDVGNPSNFPRLLSLYEGSVEKMRQELVGVRVTDDEIREAIVTLEKTQGYLLDPHSAVAYRALLTHLPKEPAIFFGTAHPAKFPAVYKGLIDREVPVPESLKGCFTRTKQTTSLTGGYPDLKGHLVAFH